LLSRLINNDEHPPGINDVPADIAYCTQLRRPFSWTCYDCGLQGYEAGMGGVRQLIGQGECAYLYRCACALSLCCLLLSPSLLILVFWVLPMLQTNVAS
jgi:hypothetical protein